MNVRRAERAYGLLLRAYPSEFRAAFGREMTSTFRDLVRDSSTPRMLFWIEIMVDVARTAPARHVDALRTRFSSPTTSSRLISRPTTKKNTVMSPSLTQACRSR